MEAYFADAGRIALGILIVDARHKPTGDDVTMADWFKSTGRPFVVAANKVDKVKSSGMEAGFAVINETLGLPETTRAIPFSAEKGINRNALLSKIEGILSA